MNINNNMTIHIIINSSIAAAWAVDREFVYIMNDKPLLVHASSSPSLPLCLPLPSLLPSPSLCLPPLLLDPLSCAQPRWHSAWGGIGLARHGGRYFHTCAEVQCRLTRRHSI